MKSKLDKASPYGLIKFKSIEEYHAAFPEEIQAMLLTLYQTIKKIIPQADEVISYNMPTFKLHQNVVYYAAYKEHIGFYPTPNPIEFFKEELKNYKTSKGAIQFPINKPLPINLIQKIVKFRLKECLDGIEKKKNTNK